MVYFIQCGDAVKIGYTAKRTAKDRIAEMQTGNPGKLKTLLFMDGSRKDEANFHEMFSMYRVRGEWFHLVSEIVEFIDCKLYKRTRNQSAMAMYSKKTLIQALEKKLGRFIPSKQVAFDVIG